MIFVIARQVEVTMHFKHEMIGKHFKETSNKVKLRINRARPVPLVSCFQWINWSLADASDTINSLETFSIGLYNYYWLFKFYNCAVSTFFNWSIFKFVSLLFTKQNISTIDVQLTEVVKPQADSTRWDYPHNLSFQTFWGALVHSNFKLQNS